MSFDDEDTDEAHERRITRCKEQTCRKQIIFLPTINGGNMPVDADTVNPDDEEYEPNKHTSHFSTCKKPNRF